MDGNAKVKAAADTVARAAVAGDIRRLMSLLSLRPSEVGSLLRGTTGGEWPSAQLIRLALQEVQNPSPKFARLVATRLAEVEAQIATGVQSLEIAGRRRAIYVVTPQRHLTVLASAEDMGEHGEGPDAWKSVLAASLSIPADWVGVCADCGRPMVKRQPNQRYCRRQDETGGYPCLREGRRLRDRASADRKLEEVTGEVVEIS